MRPTLPKVEWAARLETGTHHTLKLLRARTSFLGARTGIGTTCVITSCCGSTVIATIGCAFVSTTDCESADCH